MEAVEKELYIMVSPELVEVGTDSDKGSWPERSTILDLSIEYLFREPEIRHENIMVCLIDLNNCNQRLNTGAVGLGDDSGIGLWVKKIVWRWSWWYLVSP